MSFWVQSERTKVKVNEAGITQSKGCEQGIQGEGMHLSTPSPKKYPQDMLLPEGLRLPLTQCLLPSASIPFR